ncbi:MAG: CT583 family protein [Parachlamydiales bacterium]|nr:CT583 family protein [Parachlamydiales bacterium]
MSKINSILFKRLRGDKDKGQSKMAELAKRTADGQLTSFSGVFGFTELSETEKERLTLLLQNYAYDEQDIQADLRSLSALTSEVKAITNQAAILHGERIKKAQTLLKNYKEGAFSAWLVNTYGNRQTPYNFLQYFEFFEVIPKALHPLVESMPRQAVYTLASREGTIDKKEEIIRNSTGLTKQEILTAIREMFPLGHEDGRRQNAGDNALHALKRLFSHLQRSQDELSNDQRNEIHQLLQKMKALF